MKFEKNLILKKMKKIIMSFAIFAFVFANAQENIVKVNPLSVLGGTDLFSVEHALNDNSSLVVGAGIGGFKIGDAKYSNLGAELQYRFYFNEVLEGFYAGGQVGYSSGKVEIVDYFFDEINETNFGAFKLGGKGGYQWIWGSGLSLDLNLGIAYNRFSYKNSDPLFSTLEYRQPG